MLSDAILSIRHAQAMAQDERERQRAERAALTQAEDYSAAIEELLLDGATELPRTMAVEIRGFVAEHERGLVHRLGDAVSTLDALFDLQERLQTRRRCGEVDLTGRRVA